MGFCATKIDGMIVVKVPLDSEQKRKVIEHFYNCYDNTDQQAEVFGSEFFHIVGNVLSGYLPLQTRHLTKEFVGALMEIIPCFKDICQQYEAGTLVIKNEVV
jgi:hypothetical protein